MTMMDTSTNDNESKDPSTIWEMMSSLLRGLMTATASAVEELFTKFSQLLSSFPQIICPTTQWPDSIPGLATRRRAFVLAIMRTLLQLSARTVRRDQGTLVGAGDSLLSGLEDRSPQVWRDILGILLGFWERMTETEITPTCKVVFTEESLSDELFPDELDTVAVTSPEMKERLQCWVTSLVTRQLRFLPVMDSLVLEGVHSSALDQLCLGEPGLVGETLLLLVELHTRHGWPAWRSHLWAQECHLTVQLLELVSRGEAEAVRSDMVQYFHSLLPLMEREETLVLSNQLLPLWRTQSDLDSVPADIRKVNSHLLETFLQYESDLNGVSQVINQTSDIELQGSLASRELADSLKSDRQGPAVLLSPAWSSLTSTVTARIGELSDLQLFSRILQKVLLQLVRMGRNFKLELVSKSLMMLVTDRISELMASGEVMPGLSLVSALLQTSQVAPTASELSTLQHCWAGLLSLPWLPHQEDRLADLQIGTMTVARDVLFGSQKSNKWGTEDKNKALYLLGLLPTNICPRWRLQVFKLAWEEKLAGVIDSLPAIARLSSSALQFSKDLVQDITGRVGGEGSEDVCRLAEVAGTYICSLAACTEVRLSASEDGELRLGLKCEDCEAELESEAEQPPVSSTELDCLLRLMCYKDRSVRLALVRLLPRAAAHCDLSSDAVTAWMNCVSDPKQEVRFSLAENVHHILRARRSSLPPSQLYEVMVASMQSQFPSGSSDCLDSYICTLQSVFLSQPKGELPLLNLLLELYFSADTTVTTSVNALPTLREALKCSHRHHILAWSARRMCQSENPQQLLTFLLLLCRGQQERSFLEANLHHILPPVLLVAGDPASRTGAERTLEMFSSYLEQNIRLTMMLHLPVLFRQIVIGAADQKHLQSCISYLERITEEKMESLLSSYRVKVLVELITMFEYSKARIVQGLGMCAKVDTAFVKKKKVKLTQSCIASYVSQSLQAILASFVTSFSNPATSGSHKLQCLKSLNELMSFLKYENLKFSKYALLDCVKLATTLSKTDSQFEEAAVSLWMTFIKNFECSDLVSILPQILVGILPHLETSPKPTLEIFSFLLVENVEQFRSKLKDLMFLPSHPKLDDLMRSVRGEAVELKHVISSLVRSLDSECVDVRLQTVRTLSSVLDSNTGGVQGLVLCSDRTDPLVTSLISGLMNALSFREPDAEVRYLAGLCLGKLGPVDPGKLDFVVNLGGVAGDEDSRSSVLDVMTSGFCVELLQELVRAQSSAREPLIAENCSYSIQEVLKLYQIDKKTSFSRRVWVGLSGQTQEKVTPLLSSLYIHKAGERPLLTSPIYLSQHGRTLRDWLVNWTHSLTSLLIDDRKRKLFQVCLPALKKDLTIGELLLPRLVIEVLCQCNEENNEALMNEINCIIKTHEVEDRHLQQSVVQNLFSVQDHILVWIKTKLSDLMAKANRHHPKKLQETVNNSKEYLNVTAFVERISNEDLANLSYKVAAYHRSAFHFELHLKDRRGRADQSCLSSLQRLYVSLEEPDLVLGVAAVRKEEPSLREQVEHHQATGNYNDALCCLQLLNSGGGVSSSVDLIQCYLNIDQPSTASALAAQLSQKQSTEDLTNLQAEAAWQLSQWEQLETLTSTSQPNSTGWNLGLGKLLLAVKKDDLASVRDQVRLLRQEVVDTITSRSLEHGAYQRSYRYICQLGMLNEVQLICDSLLLSSPDCSLLSSELRTRLSLAQNSWSSLQPLLRLRRSCLALAEEKLRSQHSKVADRLQQEVGECWLQSAQLARRSGLLQQSHRFLLEAGQVSRLDIFQEKARLSWARNKKIEAIRILQRGLTDNFSQVEEALVTFTSKQSNKDNVLQKLESLSSSDKEVLCRGKILLAQYLEEAANVSTDGISAIYQQAKTIAQNKEEVFFLYGRSIDRQIHNLNQEQQLQHSDLVLHTCAYYNKSILNGPTHLHYCLPRILTIWLDFADVVNSAVKSKTHKNRTDLELLTHSRNTLNKMVENINLGLSEVPLYYLVTALPQLVSRLCHQHDSSYQVLSRLLVSLLDSQYSQQTFWQLISVSKNRDKVRSSRCHNIFEEAVKRNPELRKFLEIAVQFTNNIDALCGLKVKDSVTELSIKESLPSLAALSSSSGFPGSVILPNQKNMLVSLPTAAAKVSTHKAFPSGLVYIQSVEDEVHVLSSMVRPKKICLLGSDGKRYPFLAKPRDDLRRDSRLMDCIGLLNRLLRKDVNARSRNLHIRTYAVVSTNETSGLIEWISNLQAIRFIIRYLQRKRGLCFDGNSFESPKDASLEARKKNLSRCIEAQGGAVFSQWFVENFSDPQSWLMARMSYVRSTAVISMLGYIIGLGDRHLENINVDVTNGETFHVDLNCLFNKGEEFKVPETVPFRLTHNIVDAFGPVGVEGPFRISCEIALSVMRREKDVLMSVLRPFVYDPLVDWKKTKAGGDSEVGTVHLQRVEDRLRGFVCWKRKDSSHPLSVEGQVSYLIRQAMDPANLAVMFWGWAPYY